MEINCNNVMRSVHDLYSVYQMKLLILKEQQLLEQYETIIQFPLYWYSYPPLFKQYLMK